MAIHAFRASNLILEKGRRDGIPVDPMKLQKLLYLMQGWNLAYLDAGLISQEFEAWAYGPVVPQVYREFKSYGSSPISEDAHFVGDTLALSPSAQTLCENVWQTYRGYSGAQLSSLTHEPGYAWELARKGAEPWSFGSPVIPNEAIRSEFRERLRRGSPSNA